MDGRAYLEKLIADGLSVPNRITLDRSEVRGVALGLLAAGAIARSDMERILADLDETLKQAGLLRVMRAEKLLTGSGGGLAGVARPEWRRAIEDPPAPVLRHVFSLAGRTFELGDVVENLISLEVWSTFLRLNLAHGGEDNHRMTECFERGVKWRGWDDAGTQYRDAGGSGSSVQSLHARNRVFTPGPADHARLLTLVVDHGDGPVTLEIPLGASARNGQES
jgi:hypothetical protein